MAIALRAALLSIVIRRTVPRHDHRSEDHESEPVLSKAAVDPFRIALLAVTEKCAQRSHPFCGLVCLSVEIVEHAHAA